MIENIYLIRLSDEERIENFLYIIFFFNKDYY